MINSKYDGVYSVQRFNLQDELQDWSVASCPEINQELQRVIWKEGERGRVVDYTKINDLKILFPETKESSASAKDRLPSKVTVIDHTTNSLYILQPLTLKIYRENIRLLA